MGEPIKPPCCVLKEHMAAVGKGFPLSQQLSAHLCGLVDLIIDDCGLDNPDRVLAYYESIGNTFQQNLFAEIEIRRAKNG